jgi:hypothetical protein
MSPKNLDGAAGWASAVDAVPIRPTSAIADRAATARATPTSTGLAIFNLPLFLP